MELMLGFVVVVIIVACLSFVVAFFHSLSDSFGTGATSKKEAESEHTT